MGAYVTAGFMFAMGLSMLGLQFHRDKQNKPSPAWGVKSVQVTTVYHMKAPGMKGYQIRHSDWSGTFRVMKWNGANLVFDESTYSFAAAERLALKHAGISLKESPSD